MTITKREYSAIDAQPVVLYAKQDDGSVTAFPIVTTNGTIGVTQYIADEHGALHPVLGDTIYQGVPLSIDVAHHEIHCGDSYEMTHSVDLSNGQVYEILIQVPNEPGTGQAQKQYHLKGMIDTEAEAVVELFEGTTFTASGSTLAIINRNRNLATEYMDFLPMYYTPTVSSSGTRIYVRRIGSSRSYGGSAGREEEIILKNNTNYLMRVTNATVTANWCNFDLNYYVHPGV